MMKFAVISLLVGGMQTASLESNKVYYTPTAINKKKVALVGTKYKIAVVDSGFDQKLTSVPVKTCKTGSYDFTRDTEQQMPIQPHGTYVAATIAQQLDSFNVNYCIMSYQVVAANNNVTEDAVSKAVRLAVKDGASAINISLSGPAYFDMEKKAIEYAVSKGVAVFIAAGNDRRNLNEHCIAFPACYKIPGATVVGAIDRGWQYPESYSNYGAIISAWYPGFFLDREREVYDVGTSFAAPRATAMYIYSMALLQAGQ